MADQKFTETEVLGILRKATEYQWSANPTEVDGFSEEQVRAMAVELGLSVQAVDMALRAGPEPVATRWYDRYIGAPVDVRLDRTFPGEVDGEIWADSVHGFRERFGVHGTIGTAGSGFEWTSGDRELLGVSISASTKGGRTRVRASTDGWGAVVLSTMVIGIVSMLTIMAAVKVSDMLTYRVVIGLVIAFFAVGLHRRVLGGMFRRRQEALEQAVSEFEALLPSQSVVSTHVEQDSEPTVRTTLGP